MQRRAFQRGLRTCIGAFLIGVLIAGIAPTLCGATTIGEGDLVLFPIETVPLGAFVYSTDNVTWVPQGEGYSYGVSRTEVYNPSGNDPDPGDPSTWTILTYEGTVTYLPGSGGVVPPELAEASTFLLTLTSLREGPFDGGALPPRIDGGYVLPSFSGLSHPLVYVSDPVGGAVTDEEGDLFLALAFAALPDVPQTFGFQVALREPLDDTLQHFNRGFASPVPEPSSFVLFGFGFGVVLLAQRRARSGRSGAQK
jgi:hypothetical protein